MVTDYDCWHEEHDAVTVNDIMQSHEERRERGKGGGRSRARMPEARFMQMRLGAGARYHHRSQSRARFNRKKLDLLIGKYFVVTTSCEDQARELLGLCLRGERWPRELLTACSTMNVRVSCSVW